MTCRLAFIHLIHYLQPSKKCRYHKDQGTIDKWQKKLTPKPLFHNGQYQAGWNTNQNQMKNIHPFYIVFQGFEGTSYKNATTRTFISCFTLAFKSVDIIFFFYIFLELHSMLSKKITFIFKFSFFNGFSQTLHPQRP